MALNSPTREIMLCRSEPLLIILVNNRGYSGLSGLGGGPFYGPAITAAADSASYSLFVRDLGFARQALNCQGSAPVLKAYGMF